MRFLTCLLLAPFALGEQLVIPEVQAAIAGQLSRFSKYTSFKGTATVATPTSAPHVTVNAVAAPAVAEDRAVVAPGAATTPSPYWYETIAHQGKAAFNTNASYVVYRNVKSYGAKGCVTPSHLTWKTLMSAQRWCYG